MYLQKDNFLLKTDCVLSFSCYIFTALKPQVQTTVSSRSVRSSLIGYGKIWSKNNGECLLEASLNLRASPSIPKNLIIHKPNKMLPNGQQ